MLVGRNVVVRTAREADLERLYDPIADVRTMGDHWPLTVGSESSWIKQFRENGWWTDDFGRMLVTDRGGNCLGYVNYTARRTASQGLKSAVGYFVPRIAAGGS